MSSEPKTEQLRSSCDRCGEAKIRCTKEKPKCSRCVDRGLTCSYSVPRRTGRPPQDPGQFIFKTVVPRSPKSSSSSSSGHRHQSRRSPPQEKKNDAWDRPALDTTQSMRHTVSRNSSISGGRAMPPTRPSTSRQGTSRPGTSSAASSPAAYSTGAASASMHGSRDEFWAPAFSMSTKDIDDIFEWDYFGGDSAMMDMGTGQFAGLIEDHQHATSSTCLEATSNLDKLHTATTSPFQFNHLAPTPIPWMPDYQSSVSATSTTPPSLSSSRTNSTNSSGSRESRSSGRASVRPSFANVGHKYQPRATSCSCESQIIDLLAHPSPAQASRRNAAEGQPAASFESVLDLNLLATDAVAQILRCSCHKDAYTVVILILSTCKTLEWYETAASVGHSYSISAPNAGIGGLELKGEDPRRIASQIVLSRLSSIRGIVEALSAEVEALHESEASTGSKPHEAVRSHAYDHAKPLPAGMEQFLAINMMRPLQADLRKRTLALAQRVIAQLR